ncbi:dephospho-CoA kinase [Caldimonas brevitalea]|uniref:Dephospho-CoA kinase n=1 Tax=Caldimonas brevitalea TaxID=413882 RepID=A0A0G3BPF7_9BURK|nr:dephospho-CoA kinase [Caldimonas brevitalea]AKJ31304.1 dephospho-CoA kinase [Caldimonas brevitalea]
MTATSRRIGLTGGIGSGKSTVAAMLADLGALIVDTDAISRSLSAAGGAAIPALRTAFGDDFIDAEGALDRARMRSLVFQDPSARTRLERLLHPLIGQETVRQAALATPGQPVVFDVPLLVESGRWRALVDWVLVVDCTPETQVERVVQRSQLAPAEVERIIAQQAPRAARLAAADVVICNDGLTLQELEAEVRAVWQRWQLDSPAG